MKQTLLFENLTCAHCASKIEQKIAATEGYEAVSFNFATKRLQFNSEKTDCREEIQAICDSIEDGVRVVLPEAHREHSYHHDHEHCDHHDHDHCDHHDHDHDHDHSHHHDHGEKSKAKTALLIVAAALGLIALVLHLAWHGDAAHWTVFALSLVAALCAGYDVFLKGVKNAFRLRIEETVLITVAVIAAFFLGEFVEAAMVTILFSVGEFIEDLAVGKSRRDIESAPPDRSP